MAKQTTPSRVAVETKIGRIVFRSKPNGAFIVRMKGQDRIRIRLNKESGSWEADAKYFNKHGVETIWMGRTAKMAYKEAIKAAWF